MPNYDEYVKMYVETDRKGYDNIISRSSSCKIIKCLDENYTFINQNRLVQRFTHISQFEREYLESLEIWCWRRIGNMKYGAEGEISNMKYGAEGELVTWNMVLKENW